MDQAADKQFSGIYGTAVNETHWLSIPTNADLVSGDAFKTADLIDGNTTVFVQIPIDALGNFPGVARVIIGSLMKAVYRAEGNLDGRVLFELDEAYRLGYMKIIEEARDAGRKCTTSPCSWSTSRSDSSRSSGASPARTSGYSTVSWRGYAAVRDVATADELSKEFGHYSVWPTRKATIPARKAAFRCSVDRVRGDTTPTSTKSSAL